MSRVDGTYRPKWLCRCDCGKEKPIWATSLHQGRTISCGCYNAEKDVIHGLTGAERSPEYAAWADARRRCHDLKNRSFHNYGGRGIVMCPEWREDPLQFIADVGKKPGPKYTLERVDNDGPYSAANCRWASRLSQSANRRNTAMLSIEGERVPLMTACRERGVSTGMVNSRLRRGWSDEAALLTPALR